MYFLRYSATIFLVECTLQWIMFCILCIEQAKVHVKQMTMVSLILKTLLTGISNLYKQREVYLYFYYTFFKCTLSCPCVDHHKVSTPSRRLIQPSALSYKCPPITTNSCTDQHYSSFLSRLQFSNSRE